MKSINRNLVLVVMFYTTSLQGVYASRKDVPVPRGSGGFDNGGVVGGAIDNYLLVMFFVAILLGVWFLNKLSSKNTLEEL